MLGRFEVLGLVVEGRLEGRVAGRAAGLELLAGGRDIVCLEARCPIRWASTSSGVRKHTKRTARVAFRNDAVESFSFIRTLD